MNQDEFGFALFLVAMLIIFIVSLISIYISGYTKKDKFKLDDLIPEYTYYKIPERTTYFTSTTATNYRKRKFSLRNMKGKLF